MQAPPGPSEAETAFQKWHVDKLPGEPCAGEALESKLQIPKSPTLFHKQKRAKWSSKFEKEQTLSLSCRLSKLASERQGCPQKRHLLKTPMLLKLI